MAKYNPFECCHHCVPPKRHPGCQDHCPEYAEAKINHEIRKALINADREAREYTRDLIYKNMNKTAKKEKAWRTVARRHGKD